MLVRIDQFDYLLTNLIHKAFETHFHFLVNVKV